MIVLCISWLKSWGHLTKFDMEKIPSTLGVAVMSIHRKNCCEWSCCCSEFRLQVCLVYEKTKWHGLWSRTCEIRLSGDKIWQRPVVEAQVW